jgi:hypothetical protein
MLESDAPTSMEIDQDSKNLLVNITSHVNIYLLATLLIIILGSSFMGH